jgi:thiosulfate reductase cytochrome b subunit
MTMVYIYKRFERFWHWSQAGLIIFLAFTGFEVHDSFHFFGFENAVRYHRVAAYMLLILTTFSIFWHLTTGEWKHYIPTLRNLKSQIQYYAKGIFEGAPHPFRKNALQKLNPLQVFTYLGFKLFLIPLTVGTGLLYMSQKWFDANNTVMVSDINLETVAVLHTLGGYLLMAFLVVHVYMTTTGHTPLSNIRAMVTGYEETEDDATEKESEQPT